MAVVKQGKVDMKTNRISQRIQKTQNYLEKKYPRSKIQLSWDGRSVHAEGDSPTVSERHEIGVFIVKKWHSIRGYKGLVNDMTVGSKTEPSMKLPDVQDSLLDNKAFDVVIIGGGVIGCAIARELSRYKLNIAVLEKECDVAMQASGRNDGMIHPGFADNPSTIKGRLNSRGNRLYHRLDKELGFETKWPGSYFLFKSRLLRLAVPYMNWRAKRNNVDGTVGYHSARCIVKAEPHLGIQQHGGYWMPSAGVASPFRVTVAFAENAQANGVHFYFETAVTGMDMVRLPSGREPKLPGSVRISAVHTNRGTIRTGLVINAAGVWSDKVAGFAGDRFFSIHPRKGMDMILDKKVGVFLKTIVGMPDLLSSSKKHSKGGGLIPCIEGNALVGPTAREVYDREDYSTDVCDMPQLEHQIKMNFCLNLQDVIAYYSGIRAADWEEDFIVEGSEKVSNLVHAAAIQSPGFASAPAIAQDIVKICIQRIQSFSGCPVLEKNFFRPVRRALPELSKMEDDERNELIAGDPSYGKIVCRCEQISEGEIRDAVRSCIRLGMKKVTVDAVKRRCRAGAGRCHGGFCRPRVMEIISRETGVPMTEITQKGGLSLVLGGTV
jgi:glycerol-3-phosphate dehydrogenase